ncbi:MAG: hypothetical protein NTZ63_05350 [Candidatus Omnitrophica bacterium]|nr:hypothetical protein [Candidatus Omnitrophota bacterium]
MLKKVIKDLAVITVLALLPIIILLNTSFCKNGLLNLIFFGERFSVNRLKVIKDVDLPALTPVGYDGQFYAQLALDPFLVHGDIVNALDAPAYRARRIGLPFLSFIFGFGNPLWVLRVYALINFAFWGLLLVALYQYSGFRYKRDFLLAVSLLWSTGTLVSLARALTDFPAATLSVLAVFLIAKRKIAAWLLSFAILCKETSGLSLFLLIWPEKNKKVKPCKIILLCSIVIIPIAVWLFYLKLRLNGSPFVGNNNFTLPFLGVISKVVAEGGRFFKGLTQLSDFNILNLLFEFICPLSLLVQSLYMIVKPRVSSPFWRLGIGFTVLIFILGNAIWVEQIGYCRVLLILTFCFNFLIHKDERGIPYVLWYFMGNVGMAWMSIKLLSGFMFKVSF